MSKLSKIAVLAIEALGDELSQTIALEKILRICTDKPNMESAKKAALDMRVEEKNLATVKDFNMSHYKAKYGYYESYSKFELALDYFQMSNDLFFEKYKFNFVPKGELYKEVKKLLEERVIKQAASQMISATIGSATSSGIDAKNHELNSLFAKEIKRTFRSGV
ncbi:hypothetical protein IW492_02785 [Enterococcus sp. BWB1-3]|uniref:hypothetical protein n=1 Tax=Enterococcus sp. BWB1-3 TaxID=2787713 RepID=UPI0019236C7A|nr:hypothetical protein [Enterococcus sp. BWB1-3]MBL1228157.1 hypothetical protein [Enterococcus sp. BWB1-3]